MVNYTTYIIAEDSVGRYLIPAKDVILEVGESLSLQETTHRFLFFRGKFESIREVRSSSIKLKSLANYFIGSAYPQPFS